MALWTDIIDPAELTGYARASLEEYEASQGTLAQFLPNREVLDTVVRFVMGQSGLVEEAKYRAFDAEPEVGKGRGGRRVVLELAALSETQTITEYEQLRTRGATDESIEKSIFSTTRRVVRAISDRAERLRGIVLSTGRATIPELLSDDNFGRSAAHDVNAPARWSDLTADRLGFLQSIVDVYEGTNGIKPGALLMPTRVYNAMAAGNQFKNQLLNGVSRPASRADVDAVIEGADLPPIVTYGRRTKSGKILDDSKLMLLPAPVATDDWEGTELGATFWGQTLTSTDERYAIEESEQPGIVAGVYRGEKPPMIAEVVGDSINLPVLANADLSLAAKVL